MAAATSSSPSYAWRAKCISCGSDYVKPPPLWDCVQCGNKVWQPDDSTQACMVCNAPVSKGARHHCRKCGRVTCDACTTVSIIIPEWGKEKHKVCTQCAVPEAPLALEGWLFKLGEKKFIGGERFQKRWFCLREKALIYADSPTSPPKGSISIHDVKVIDVATAQHAFCIMGPLLQRSYVLRCDTPQDKERWTQAIRRAVGSEGNADDDDDRTEAVLYNRDGPQAPRAVCMADFDLLTVLGLGSFGRVMKVKEKATGHIYAMKVMDKEQVVANKMVNHTQAEKDILGSIDHPFICRLYYAFQTKKHLVLVMDFLCGGELFFHLQRCKRFSESRAKFYAAEIGLALAYIHDRNIIYRDLKPENLVLSREGHVTLTDFGLAKRDMTGPAHTFCGTPEYMAPELIMRRGHTKAVDWWALGVLLYEMVSGLPPFYSSNTGEMYDMVLHRPLTFPKHFSPELQNILARLLERDPAKRLQTGDEFKRHPFFKDLDLVRLERREIRPEFVPDISDNDLKYVDQQFTRASVHTPHLDQPVDPNDALAQRFSGFGYTSEQSLSGSPSGSAKSPSQSAPGKVVIDQDLL
jgi:serine/threonine protein kinase